MNDCRWCNKEGKTLQGPCQNNQYYIVDCNHYAPHGPLSNFVIAKIKKWQWRNGYKDKAMRITT